MGGEGGEGVVRSAEFNIETTIQTEVRRWELGSAERGGGIK